MKNLEKNLLLLIVIFPAVILLSSLFAEKAMGQGLSACGENLTCSASTFEATCSPTQTKCLSKKSFLTADQLQTGESVVCCNNPSAVTPTPTPAPTSPQITPPTCFDDCMALLGKTEASCSKQCGLSVPAPTPACNYNNIPDGCSGGTQWCDNGTCNSCTYGFLNCDQTRGCEVSGNSCSAPTPVPPTLKWKPYIDCSAQAATSTSAPGATATPIPTPTPTLALGVTPTITPIPTPIPVRIFTPSPTQPVTPTPTPNLSTQCSPDNPNFSSTKGWGFDYQCLSSCNKDWAEVALTSLANCPSGTLCCYKAPFGFIKPSSTGGPTPTPGVSSNDTFLTISLSLEGVGNTSGSNPNPKTPTRQTTIDIFSSSKKQESTTKPTAALTYDSTSGLFKGTANLGAFFPSGNYLVKIKSERYLKRLLPGIINITSGQTITLPTLILLAGDVNGDNNIDALDYNIFVSCFGPKATTASCTNKATADVNDDGVVDGVDYNLFVHSLAIRRGD